MKYRPLLLSLFAFLFLFIAGTSIETTLTQASTTIIVTTTDDELNSDEDCSLREAIRAANADSTVSGCPAGSGADTIILPSGIYTLTIVGSSEDAALTGDLDITADLTINGESASTTIVNGNGGVTSDRVLHVTGARVVVSRITIQNGNTGGGANGGGILNYGTLTLTTSIISGNVAAHAAGILNVGTATIISSTISHNMATDDAGGIRNDGTLTVINSIINHNTATYGSGGGILNHGTLIISNSTVTSNLANGFGGGIYNGSGPFSQGSTLSLNNVTITNNTADTNNDGYGTGGGVHNVPISTLNIKNTILGGNLGPVVSPDCSGTLNSQGHNLIQSTAMCTIGGNTTGNVIGEVPSLGPLQDNSGPTLTHALLPGSPAIDAGNPATPGSGGNACEATDQRGLARPQNAACDIGAYESYLLYLPIILHNS